MLDWNSLVVIARKPGPGDDLHLCANYRNLNNRMQIIQYPITLIDNILSSLEQHINLSSKISQRLSVDTC